MAQWYEAVHSAKRFRLGTKKKSVAGNEYVYLAGVTACAVNKWVSFNPTGFIAVLLAADAVGQVAIAQATVDAATKYGWFQVYGYYATASSDTVSAAGGLFIDGTAGRVDDQS